MYCGNGLQLTTKKGMYLISWTRSKVWKIFLNLPHSHILSWNFSPSYRKRWGYQLFEKAVVLLWLPPLSNNLFPLFLVSIICHPLRNGRDNRWWVDCLFSPWFFFQGLPVLPVWKVSSCPCLSSCLGFQTCPWFFFGPKWLQQNCEKWL